MQEDREELYHSPVLAASSIPLRLELLWPQHCHVLPSVAFSVVEVEPSLQIVPERHLPCVAVHPSLGIQAPRRSGQGKVADVTVLSSTLLLQR